MLSKRRNFAPLFLRRFIAAGFVWSIADSPYPRGKLHTLGKILTLD
jgi:hypothetical protein